MRIGSLCSGAGGLDLAVEQVFGAKTAWHCEIDPAASKVLAHRWPGVPNFGDLTEVNWNALRFHINDIDGVSLKPDILTGGYPCQPFSHAGKRKGTDDERHIWPYIREAIRRIRPRYTFLENVSGHRSLGFDRVLGDLAEDGMHVRWTSLRASDIGAPHQRERLFILVTDPERQRYQQALGSTTREASGAPFATDGHYRASGCVPLDLLPGIARACGNGELLPTPTSRDHKGHNQRRDKTCLTGALLPTPAAADGSRGQDLARANRDGSGGDDLVTLVVKADRAQQWGKYVDAITRWESIVGRAPSPTEPNRNGNPRLNPAFSEWMMGWPAGWVTEVPGISRNDQLRIIGNGVVPLQAEAALRWLLEAA